MLERMIIDISKWIIIILIFFVAFACSLYLIFSNFAVSSEQYSTIHGVSKTGIPQILTLTSHENLTTEINERCTAYYTLMNKSKPYITDMHYTIKTDSDDTDSCSKTKHYDKIEKIGPIPAIHYFGKNFGATILTTFFSLFGVIAEDDIPVITKKFFCRSNNIYVFGF